VALDHLVDVGDLLLEIPEIFAMMIGQRDLGEDRRRLPELREIDVRVVADNTAGLFEPLDALQAGAGGERVRPDRCSSARILMSMRSSLLSMRLDQWNRRSPTTRSCAPRARHVVELIGGG